MRPLMLTTAFTLLGTVVAQAHWPLTYVGSPAIHRFDGSVRQVTLVQPHVEQAQVLVGELSGRGHRNPECAIESGAFLKEPLSDEAKIGGVQLFDDEPLSLNGKPGRPTSAPQSIDIKDGEQPKGSAFDGMWLAGD